METEQVVFQEDWYAVEFKPPYEYAKTWTRAPRKHETYEAAVAAMDRQKNRPKGNRYDFRVVRVYHSISVCT